MTTAAIIAPSPAPLSVPLFAPTPRAAQRFVEFFTAQVANGHTRKAYLNATSRFAAWCQAHETPLGPPGRDGSARPSPECCRRWRLPAMAIAGKGERVICVDTEATQ